MRMKNEGISDVLFSKTQQQILGLLYVRPDADFYTNQVIRLTKSGTGAVQRELKKLAAVGLVTIKQIGNQKHYQANRNTPFFAELRGLILKTFGLAEVLKETLSPLGNKIQWAYIYGSIARQEDTVSSDIDLLIISEQLTYSDIFHFLIKAEEKLGRKINPNLYTLSEWIKKQKEKNNFILQLIKQQKIFLIGTENEFFQFTELNESRPNKGGAI